MSSFGDEISFADLQLSIKKPKAKPKVTKHGKTLGGKAAKTSKSGKPAKGRKPPQQMIIDAEPSSSGPGVNKAKKKEEAIDLEQQFILRMPPGPAMALRRDVQSGAMNLKDKLAVELENDMRHARVTYGGQVMNAKLVDLPTIIQCMKTTDMKTFYTTADICQMLVCVSDDEDKQDDTSKRKDKDSKWKWNHGITPPLKNVRKRRFRKTMRKKSQDQPDIEKEVRRLFRMDCEAIDVKWEVVIEDDNPNESAEKQILAHGGTMSQETDTKGMDNSLLDIAEEAIFGEVSSSEEEDEDEKDVNIVDSEEELRENSTMDFTQMGGDSTNMSDAAADVNLNAKMQELSKQIEDLRNKRMNLEIQMESEDNYLAKERLQNELQNINEEENRKEQESHILSSMLNQ